MTKLAPAVEALLEEVEAADCRFRMEQIAANERAKASLAVESAAEGRQLAVRAAFDAGAPKARLLRALSTKNRATVNAILFRTDPANAEMRVEWAKGLEAFLAASYGTNPAVGEMS